MQAWGLTYFYLLLYRNAKNYVEQHSGDLNKLQHFKESRIRVGVILSLFFVLLPFHERRLLHLGQFKHMIAEILSLLLVLVSRTKYTNMLFIFVFLVVVISNVSKLLMNLSFIILHSC